MEPVAVEPGDRDFLPEYRRHNADAAGWVSVIAGARGMPLSRVLQESGLSLFDFMLWRTGFWSPEPVILERLHEVLNIPSGILFELAEGRDG